MKLANDILSLQSVKTDISKIEKTNQLDNSAIINILCIKTCPDIKKIIYQLVDNPSQIMHKICAEILLYFYPFLQSILTAIQNTIKMENRTIKIYRYKIGTPTQPYILNNKLC